MQCDVICVFHHCGFGVDVVVGSINHIIGGGAGSVIVDDVSGSVGST